MKRSQRFGLVLICLVTCLGTAAGNTASAEKAGAVGIRAGVGTDIEGGLAYGAQLNYTLFQGPNAFELGLAVFGGKFEEESSNGYNDYFEETNLLVFGALANYLFRYAMELEGPYFAAGIGVGAISVEWEERSPTDISLGTPTPDGGSMQSEDATAAGLILNFGIGYRLTEQFDLRAQVPTFFISGSDDRDGKVIPTITLTLGFNFS